MDDLILNAATVAGCITAAFATVGACNLARNLWRRRQVAKLRRRETQARRDVEAFRLARIRTQFEQIIAAEYPTIPAQRQPRKDEPR